MIHQLPRIVLGASAHNDHVQQMARALHEVNRLHSYVTGAVDVWSSVWMRGLRRLAARVPRLDRQLSRRSVTEVPADLVCARWGWDLARTMAAAAGADRGAEDWLWERAERSLDTYTARLLARPEVGGYLGIEFGALTSLRAARQAGKPGLVAFLSAHHKTRTRWLDPELLRFERRLSPEERRLEALSIDRDRLRDLEALTADGIVTGSSFTTRSLMAAGVPEHRILTVPLGGPAPVDPSELPRTAPATLKFVYAGSVAIHKGVHHLLEAWARLAPPSAELHIYGQQRLPREVIERYLEGGRARNIVLHGRVPRATLRAAYLEGGALILPTLCDGFGQVVADALAHGLPVITTSNAGSAERVAHGECGFVIPPADVEALAGRLEWCITHPDELFAMRTAALVQARRWTWAHFRHALVEGLTDMLAERRLEIARSA